MLSVCSATPTPVDAWIGCPKGTACGVAALRVCRVLLWPWVGGTRFPVCFWAVGPSLQHRVLGKLWQYFPWGTSCSQLANWAWLTALAGPLLVTTNLDSSLAEIKGQLAHRALYLLFSLLCTRVLCTLSISGCVAVLQGGLGRSLQLPTARSEGHESLGPFGVDYSILQKARRAKKAIVKRFFIKSGQLIYRDTQIT